MTDEPNALEKALERAEKAEATLAAAVKAHMATIAERDALLAASQCVITNLKKGMSQSMQKLQAREFQAAINAARKEKS